MRVHMALVQGGKWAMTLKCCVKSQEWTEYSGECKGIIIFIFLLY